MHPFVAIALSCTALMTGCSKDDVTTSKAQAEVAPTAGLSALKRQVEDWRCSSPEGGENIRPLWNLAADDVVRIKEARERIELVLREDKATWPNETWDEAESAFRSIQMHFGGDFYYPAEWKERALLALRQADDGVFPYAGTPQEFVAEKKRQYDDDCKRRNEGIKAMLAVEPKLAALRKEMRQPWLLERNRIACSLASIPNCKR